MNPDPNRSIEKQGAVTRLEIGLAVAFVGMMTTITVSVFFSPNALLIEQSREAALVAFLGICSAIVGIGARSRLAASAKQT
jgi:hypothetical protein